MKISTAAVSSKIFDLLLGAEVSNEAGEGERGEESKPADGVRIHDDDDDVRRGRDDDDYDYNDDCCMMITMTMMIIVMEK